MSVNDKFPFCLHRPANSSFPDRIYVAVNDDELPEYVDVERGYAGLGSSKKVRYTPQKTCSQEEFGWSTEGDHARVWLTCGHNCMVKTVADLPKFCPECGAKVR